MPTKSHALFSPLIAHKALSCLWALHLVKGWHFTWFSSHSFLYPQVCFFLNTVSSQRAWPKSLPIVAPQHVPTTWFNSLESTLQSFHILLGHLGAVWTQSWLAYYFCLLRLWLVAARRAMPKYLKSVIFFMTILFYLTQWYHFPRGVRVTSLCSL